MSCIRYGVAIGLVACLFPLAPARALPNDNARLALHLAPRTTKNTCNWTGATVPCNQVVTRGGLYPANLYYAYLLVVDGDPSAGVGGLDVGVNYDGAAGVGVEVFSWSLCASLELPDLGWPASGGGDLIAWDGLTRCQRNEPGGVGTGVTAIAGYFYMAAYSEDVMRLAIDPFANRQYAMVADCGNHEYVLEGRGVHFNQSHLGSAQFSASGNLDGYRPCDAPYIACALAGPVAVTPGSLIHYSAVGNTPATSYNWSVSLPGMIVGASDGPTVDVLSGSSGGFLISCLLGDGTNAYSCSELVTITPDPPCVIAGPMTLHSGEVGVYSVIATSGASYSWQLSGSGDFVGAANGPAVSVRGGPPGSVVISCEVSASSTTQRCSRTTSVTPGCLIGGLASVSAQTSGLNYQCTNPLSGATFTWSVTGEAQIPGDSHGNTVQVRSLNPGAFTLTLIQTVGSSSDTCHFTATVLGGVMPRPLIMLHLTARTTKSACLVRPACAEIKTNGGLYPNVYFAYLLASVSGTSFSIGGVQCGISYNSAAGAGVDVFSWATCATSDLPTGGWPASGGGNRFLWDPVNHCQTSEPGGAGTGVVATAGYFYMAAYTPDLLRVTPRPSDNRASILDCTGGELTVAENPPQPSPFGTINFTTGGTAPGYAPCGAAVPVRITTWGGIKALYGGAGAAVGGRPH